MITVSLGWWLLPAAFSLLMLAGHQKLKRSGFASSGKSLNAALVAWLIYFIIF